MQPLVLISTYVLFIALVLHPQIQAHNVFLHGINFPFHFDLSKPERIKSLSGTRVRNFRVVTADGISISGWHLLPDVVLHSKGTQLKHDGGAFDRSLRQYPTIICEYEGRLNFAVNLCYHLKSSLSPSPLPDFHGNAMNRGAPFRIQAYKQFTALGLNVVAVDYRGFGDSQGSPSEEGLQRDARATHRWIRERYEGQQSKDQTGSQPLPPPVIYIAGQSLGTGVATRLALDLLRVGESGLQERAGLLSPSSPLLIFPSSLLHSTYPGHPPDALFLLAPYTSIGKLLSTYKIGGLLPIFWPLGVWKTLSKLADRHLYTRFESDKAIYQIVKGRGGLGSGDDDDDDGNNHLSAEERRQYGNLDHTLSIATLREELGLRATNRQGRQAATHIIISHADNDGVIPHTHGRSLFDTIAKALEGSTRKEREYDWGTTLSLHHSQADSSSSTDQYILIRSGSGGHNSVRQHAVQLFAENVGLTQKTKRE